MQPSEMMDMPYWEMEEWISIMNQRNKEESDRQKQQEKEQHKNMPKFGDFNPAKFAPNMGGFKR